MTPRLAPFTAIRGRRAAVATADQLATQAAMAAFDRGGNAVDAALAANAALAVTAPHLCGMGGDLFALVHTPDGEVVALNASGRAGSGAGIAAEALRAEGHASVPLRHDVRAVTVPGCVDGWMAMHDRFGTLALAELFAPAIALAARGFPASPLLAAAVTMLDAGGRQQLAELAEQATGAGAPVRRPGVALTLHAIAVAGRDGFYRGAFGDGLLALGDGLYTDADLAASQAEWVEPLRRRVFGVELCTIPPNSQGYLTIGIGLLADAVGLPDDPDDPAWPHVLAEAAKLASSDRPGVLHDGADGNALLDAIAARAGDLDRGRAGRRPIAGSDGDTTYLCTADADGYAVSLIQSNASGFGSWLAEPVTGINLHDRGLGFSLESGHPAAMAPGHRPPHTLSPAVAVRDGDLVSVLGTMGGDAQPQIVAQLAARLFRHGCDVADAVAAPRWALRGSVTGFETWTAPGGPTLALEDGSPATWHDDLVARGHDVAVVPAWDGAFGHAHAIVVEPGGNLAAAADPRARIGAAAAL